MKPISTAPKDGTFILLFGPSGYTSTPVRCEVGCWSSCRQAWVTHAHDRFTDGGAEATHWMPLPAMPDKVEQAWYCPEDIANRLRVAPRVVTKWMDSHRLKCSVGYHQCSLADLKEFCEAHGMDMYL